MKLQVRIDHKYDFWVFSDELTFNGFRGTVNDLWYIDIFSYCNNTTYPTYIGDIESKEVVSSNDRKLIGDLVKEKFPEYFI